LDTDINRHKINMVSMELRELNEKVEKLSSIVLSEQLKNANERIVAMENEMMKMKEIILQIKDVHIINVKSTIHHLKILDEMIHSIELAKEKDKEGNGPKVQIAEPNYKYWKATIANLVKEWDGCMSTVGEL
ncbi:hypothetical protein KI387_022487, partial [Taxus chinensis]